MIYRFLFVGYLYEKERVRLKGESQCYAAICYDQSRVYLYVESKQKEVNPEKIAEGALICYPDGKRWQRAAEVFHYSKPINDMQWKRKLKKSPFMMMTYLKPEKISSYIYYHYQYQEEYPGDGDRYGILFLFQDCLIFYLEKPIERETIAMKGLLDTSNTPKEQWQQLMREHFIADWKIIDNIETTEYI